jgi:hypothetical protein
MNDDRDLLHVPRPTVFRQPLVTAAFCRIVTTAGYQRLGLLTPPPRAASPCFGAEAGSPRVACGLL